MANTNILTSIHALKFAHEHLSDFIRQHGRDSNGGKVFSGYVKRIEWMLNDLLTHPKFGPEIREGLRKELSADVFALPAIHESIQRLSPAQREFVENVIEHLLKGEEIIVEHSSTGDERIVATEAK